MALPLREILKMLGELAPLELAEDWDNVGLLLEPSDAAERSYQRVLCTIDLSPAVLNEAAAAGADFVLAYHPPLFKGIKRVRASHPAEQLVALALEARLPVYSPHTALDAAPDGLNDWLARGLGPGTIAPLRAANERSEELKLVVFVPREHVAALRSALSTEAGAGVIGNYSECSFGSDGQGSFFGNDAAAPVIGERGKLELVDEVRLEMICARSRLAAAADTIAKHHPYEEPAWDVYPLEPKPRAGAGAGRMLTLSEPTPLSTLAERLKAWLGVSTLRVAAPAALQPIRRVAVCAGSGGSLFESVRGADMFVTGEMRHHDVLAKVRQGSSVILSEHTHTERGFLPELAKRIVARAQGRLDAVVARSDLGPLANL